MSPMISPIVGVIDPERRFAAMSLRRKPNCVTADITRAAIAASTVSTPFTTRDTVLRLTCARRATSIMVGRRPDCAPINCRRSRRARRRRRSSPARRSGFADVRLRPRSCRGGVTGAGGRHASADRGRGNPDRLVGTRSASCATTTPASSNRARSPVTSAIPRSPADTVTIAGP